MPNPDAQLLEKQLKAEYELAIVAHVAGGKYLIEYPGRDGYFEVISWDEFDRSGYILIGRWFQMGEIPEAEYLKLHNLTHDRTMSNPAASPFACVIPWKNSD